MQSAIITILSAEVVLLRGEGGGGLLNPSTGCLFSLDLRAALQELHARTERQIMKAMSSPAKAPRPRIEGHAALATGPVQ